MPTLNVMVGQEEAAVPITVLRLEGDIDASTQSILQDKAAELIDAGTTNILLDLSGVQYMGSAGFRAIHAITNKLDQDDSPGMRKSPHLKLLNPTDDVKRVIHTLGFDVFIDIYTDRAEAIGSF